MRLIDADEFISYLIIRYSGNDCADDIIDDLNNQPTVDAVAVVRCKDCEHSYEDLHGRVCAYGRCLNCDVDEDWFCADGERREQCD